MNMTKFAIVRTRFEGLCLVAGLCLMAAACRLPGQMLQQLLDLVVAVVAGAWCDK
jgi:hypothetical protein